MLNLNSLMLGSAQPKQMSEFYTKVFEKAPDMVQRGMSGNFFKLMTPWKL